MEDFQFDVPKVQQRVPQSIVKFFMEPVQHEGRSLEEGRPIFIDREMVSIVNPGSRDEFVGAVDEQIRHQYAEQYKRWKDTQTNVIEGTPLKEWSALRPSQVAEMNAINIYSVEQLALLTDAGVQRLGMGGLELRKKAQAFIEAAKDAAAIEKYAVENERLKNQIEALQAQFKELNDRIMAKEKK
jgi:hypothetical protein